MTSGEGVGSHEPATQSASAMSVDPSVDLDEELPFLKMPDPEEEDEEEEGDSDHVNFSFMYCDRVLHDALWDAPAGFSDDEEFNADEEDVQGVEDSDDELKFGGINWANFGVGDDGELSAWDQLGVGYDKEFASIGKLAVIVHVDAAEVCSL
jgi:hypothetical protein